MRARDAVEGDILTGITGIYFRDVPLGGHRQRAVKGFKPYPPDRALICHRWMKWWSSGPNSYSSGAADIIVYLGHRWINKLMGGKISRKIIREVLFRGRPCWVDPSTWRYLEKVEEGSELCTTM